MTYELTEDTKKKLEHHIETINDVSGHGEISLLIKNKQIKIIKTVFTEEVSEKKVNKSYLENFNI